jgi:hypothetical protein
LLLVAFAEFSDGQAHLRSSLGRSGKCTERGGQISSYSSERQRQRRDGYDAKTHQRYADGIKGAQLEHGELLTRLTP